MKGLSHFWEGLFVCKNKIFRENLSFLQKVCLLQSDAVLLEFSYHYNSLCRVIIIKILLFKGGVY